MTGQQTSHILWIGARADAVSLSNLTAPDFVTIVIDPVEAALAYLSSGHPVDGMVLELEAAGGLEALATLQAQAADLPVVVLVSPTQTPLGLEAVRAGAQDYLIKGQTPPAEMIRAVGCALERHRRQTQVSPPPTLATTDDSPVATQLTDQDQRYPTIFGEVPVSLWKEDWSAVRALVNKLQPQGITDWATYHPEVIDITAPKAAKATLTTSENRFRQLFQDAAIGIAMTTPDGRFLEANAAYCQMLGYTEAELRQVDFATLTYPDDRPRNLELLHELLQGQRHSFVIEKRYFTKAGPVVWCRLSVSVQRHSDGTPISIIGVAEDITQQRQAEAALQRSQALLRVASHVSQLGAWWVDLPEMTMTWSDDMYHILEQPLDHVPHMAEANQYYAPADQAKIQAAFEACMQSGLNFDLQLQVVTARGRPIWARSIGEAVRDASGAIVRVQGAFQDITAQKAAEQQLRDSEERFRLVSKATNDAIWDWDILTDTTWRGEGYKTLFGYSDADLITANDWWRSRLHPDDRQRLLESMQTALASTAALWTDEYRFRCQDGRYAYVMDRGYIIRNDQGQAVRMIGGMLNLTEKKNLEAQLLQSQKMEAVGQLAGGIAHDFNNLLTIILGCSDMLLSALPGPDPLRAIATDIHTAGDRAANLTRHLLAFSRKQMLAPQVLNLNAVISDLEAMLRRLISADIRLISQLAPHLPAIEVDPSQLEQVILNLVVNARDAMPNGGDLTLATAQLDLGPDESLGQLNCKPGTYAALTISDTGHGMTAAVKARIFEPFFTTKPPGTGTGLGLATVFGIVKQSGGFIDVYSEPGLGTRFKLLFPAVGPRPQPSLTPALPVQQGSETILLVEDEAGVRQIAKLALERLGYQILTAANGQAALQVIARYPGSIDLVITDVVMPEMSGRELVEHLRRHHSPVKVMYISGYTDDVGIRLGVIEATDAFLQKPFTPSSLARKVREVLDQR
ncbi:PAS domain-containing protein [Nodosilinea sp. E11]|uniref:PAS domain-containing protein n=1 Tax=Nodosilinea sp. E11 TaxID=3037479 RepID=UPI0029345116|nr:PAS domain-containing protein [Nodosilinea sp. E11]WOD39419.1 PAS domain-containing protein [Nodosilinea sp. E11]